MTSQKMNSVLISSLSRIKSKVKELLNTRYFITFEILLNFEKGSYLMQTKDLVLDYYRALTGLNKTLVEMRETNNIREEKEKFLIEETQTKKRRLAPESMKDLPLVPHSTPISITNVMNVINMNLPLEPVLSTISPQENFPDSNKENVDPLEEVYVSQFNQFNFEKIEKERQDKIEPHQEVSPAKNKIFTPIRKTKNKIKKILHTTVRSEPLIYNFNFESNNNDFINSSFTESTQQVRIVCVTCRDKFVVTKEQTDWRKRCQVCTQNYEN